jgi:glycosyltransferase involved in cell wall biosynthesis
MKDFLKDSSIEPHFSENAELRKLRERMVAKNELLKVRKKREHYLKGQIKELKERIHRLRVDLNDHKAKLASKQEELSKSKKNGQSIQSLNHGSLIRNGGGPQRGWLRRRWDALLHLQLAPRVWRAEMRLGVLFHHDPKPMQKEPLPTVLPDVKLPKISVVTPSYQQADYLERTMRSVLEQGYPDLEYVVMDGGSLDGSVEIIQRYAHRLKHWQSGRDEGLSDAVQRGFTHTTGEIMAWLNSDDLWLPGTLHRVGLFFSQHPEVDAVYGHRLLIQEQDQQIGRWVLPTHDAEMNRWVDYLPQETLFWRRSAYDKAGGMDRRFKFALDWDVILRLQNTGAVFRRLPYFLGAFRVHEAQKSQTEISTLGAEECRRLRSRELGDRYNEDRLQLMVVRFQARALLHDWLLRRGIRW